MAHRYGHKRRITQVAAAAAAVTGCCNAWPTAMAASTASFNCVLLSPLLLLLLLLL
jgi:hypothetical protein